MRAAGRPFIIPPLSRTAMTGIAPARAGAASALASASFNAVCNPGGGMGITAPGAVVEEREHFRFNVMAEPVPQDAGRTVERMSRAAGWLGSDARDAGRCPCRCGAGLL